MRKSFDNYIHLAGGTGAKGSLWLGPDHLLVVEGRGWLLPISEVYRRVDYANVQALTIIPTGVHIWWSAGSGLGALIMGGLAFLARDQEPLLLVALVLPAILFLVLFGVNLVRGTACQTSLQTAVQILRLRPLSRTKPSREVLRILEERCREHQVGLAAQPSETAAIPLQPELAPLANPTELAGNKEPWSGSNWTLWTGLVLLAWGGVLMAELFVPGVLFTLLNALLGAASLTLAITSLVRVARFRTPAFLVPSLWGSVVLTLLAGTAMYVLAVVAIVKQGMEAGEPPVGDGQMANDEVLLALANFNIQQTDSWGWSLVVIGGLILLLGLTMMMRGGSKRGPASQVNASGSRSPSPVPPPFPPSSSAPLPAPPVPEEGREV
jgi:hypothetical protein